MKPRVKSDEASLREIEENKPVAKTTIAEPKTPYHSMFEEEGSTSSGSGYVGFIGYTAHAEAIRNALDEILSSRDDQEHSTDSGDETSEEEFVQGRQSYSFEDHRKQHYDEFLKVKELKQRNILFREDDGDEENRLSMREVDIGGDEEILQTISVQGSEGSSPRRSPLSSHPQNFS